MPARRRKIVTPFTGTLGELIVFPPLRRRFPSMFIEAAIDLFARFASRFAVLIAARDFPLVRFRHFATRRFTARPRRLPVPGHVGNILFWIALIVPSLLLSLSGAVARVTTGVVLAFLHGDLRWQRHLRTDATRRFDATAPATLMPIGWQFLPEWVKTTHGGAGNAWTNA
jgi:hypothetical protein